MIRFLDALSPLIGWAVILVFVGWTFFAFICAGGVCH
jgi:hypothetical protein